MGVVGPPAPDVSWQELDGRIVVFKAATGRAAALNETAAAVWQLADGRRTEADVIEVLGAAYGMSADAIGPDVRLVIDQLRTEGLLLAVPSP
jgi:hypothetical protein